MIFKKQTHLLFSMLMIFSFSFKLSTSHADSLVNNDCYDLRKPKTIDQLLRMHLKRDLYGQEILNVDHPLFTNPTYRKDFLEKRWKKPESQDLGFLLAILATVFDDPNWVERGGGDALTADFFLRSYALINQWESQRSLFSDDDLKILYDIQNNLNALTIITHDRLYLKGHTNNNSYEVDALNDPKSKTIWLSRNRWLSYQLSSQSKIDVLVLHELLSVLGYPDQRYLLTYRILRKLNPKLSVHEMPLLNRDINPDEFIPLRCSESKLD